MMYFLSLQGLQELVQSSPWTEFVLLYFSKGDDNC